MAATVMTLALTSSLSVLGRMFAPLDTARCISYAGQIMQSEMERTRITPWGDGTSILAGDGTTGVTAYHTVLAPETVIITNLGYGNANDLSSRMTLKRWAEDVHPGMIKITLTIQWTTSDGITLTRIYTTYYGKAGLYDYFAA